MDNSAPEAAVAKKSSIQVLALPFAFAILLAAFGALPQVRESPAQLASFLGAAGALEFLITVACLERGVVPATLHLDVRDPACDLDYVTEGTRTGIALNAAMSNSFAFGGTNAVLIARAAS